MSPASLVLALPAVSPRAVDFRCLSAPDSDNVPLFIIVKDFSGPAWQQGGRASSVERSPETSGFPLIA